MLYEKYVKVFSKTNHTNIKGDEREKSHCVKFLAIRGRHARLRFYENSLTSTFFL